MQEIVIPVVELGEVALDFGLVERITRHKDQGEPFPGPGPFETDTTHTVMLGLVACALAARWYPDVLDVGLVAQYALVHDLNEVYAGDTNTLQMPTAAAKKAKRNREYRAYVRLAGKFGAELPWVHHRISQYESLARPEARFVKGVDKLLPKLTHILNGARTVREQGMDAEALAARYAVQEVEMAEYASEFPELMKLRELLVDMCLEVMQRAAD